MPEPLNTSEKLSRIAEIPDVKELLALMKSNELSGVKDLIVVVEQLTAMEKHVVDMLKELKAMRLELIKARRQNYPVVSMTLRDTIVIMQANILDLLGRLTALNRDVIAGSRDALSAIYGERVSSLGNVTELLKLRSALESMRGVIDMDIGKNRRMIDRIEAASTKYRKDGFAVLNAVRDVSEQGNRRPESLDRIIEAFITLIRTNQTCLYKMDGCAGKAIRAAERLNATGHKEGEGVRYEENKFDRSAQGDR